MFLRKGPFKYYVMQFGPSSDPYLEIVQSVSGNYRFLPKNFCENAVLLSAENALINGTNKTCALNVLAETQLFSLA